MAYAPYVNSFRGDKAPVLGCFVEKTEGNSFEFIARNENDRLSFASDYPHRIFVGPYAEDTRCARVLKTVVYVVVDEDAHGRPVVEKWDTKRFRAYEVTA